MERFLRPWEEIESKRKRKGKEKEREG